MSNNPAFTYRPIYRDPFSGISTELPDGAIINIGGVSNANFTVDGKAIMLADGSTSNGDPSAWLNLQNAYENTTDADGHASIDLVSGKDFVLRGVDPSHFIQYHADTGDFTVSGNLIVSGDSTVVNSTVTDYDHIQLTPSDPTVTALRIEYDENINTAVPYIDVYDALNERSVFTVDSYGSTNVYTLRVYDDIQLSPDSLIDGIHLASLYTEYHDHASGMGPRHNASQIILDSPLTFSDGGDNVQLILEFFDSSINTSKENIVDIQNQLIQLEEAVDNIEFDQALEPIGYTYIQEVADVVWAITHNKNTKNFTYALFDSSGRQFIPNEVVMVDSNNLEVRLNAPVSGQVNIVFYVDKLTPSFPS